jgi:hypothetical protein
VRVSDGCRRTGRDERSSISGALCGLFGGPGAAFGGDPAQACRFGATGRRRRRNSRPQVETVPRNRTAATGRTRRLGGAKIASRSTFCGPFPQKGERAESAPRRGVRAEPHRTGSRPPGALPRPRRARTPYPAQKRPAAPTGRRHTPPVRTRPYPNTACSVSIRAEVGSDSTAHETRPLAGRRIHPNRERTYASAEGVLGPSRRFRLNRGRGVGRQPWSRR